MAGDWRPPLICDRLRFAKRIFDFPLDLTLRDNCIQWRLWPQILFRPNPVSPIDFFDRILIRYALGNGERPTKPLWRLVSRDRQKHSCPKGTRDTGAKKAGN